MQFGLNAALSLVDYSGRQMVSGGDPADQYLLHDGGGDLDFAKNASMSGQPAKQRMVRTRAQGVTLKEDANRAQQFVRMELTGRETAPKWRRPVAVLDTEGAGAKPKFQGQTIDNGRR